MYELKTRALVTGWKNGGEYEETHRWKAIDANGLGFLLGKLSRLADFAEKGRDKERVDDDHLTAVLQAWVDGNPINPEQPDGIVHENVSYRELMKFLHEVKKVHGDILEFGDENLARKVKNKGKPAATNGKK